MEKKVIKNSKIAVTPLCIGAAPLGTSLDSYGYEVSQKQAVETIIKTFNSPINFIDTSNNYGEGRSEERIGIAIKEYGGVPEGFVLATKVDREPDTNKFDKNRVRESMEESLKRLGVDKVPLVHFHDPEHARDLNEITKDGGAMDEMFKMKEEGMMEAVGLAMGAVDIMFPILKAYEFDAMISHNRYTLLNRSANEMFDYAHNKNIAILNAAPFAGGILAKGSNKMNKVSYMEVGKEGLVPVKNVEAICNKYNVPMGAAALQFSMEDTRVLSTIIGVSKPERVDQTIEWAAIEIPAEMKEELNKLEYNMKDPEEGRVINILSPFLPLP